ncbi:GNAT family N-acetyltransferase [Paenibacillus aurantius]|uniref:GNAT family N-acetyltransferase n=1 Tax=Paenibacillus aurantius TaxID=2918900 RepID=A0AA96LBG5_9BACL|nr:GNAT family N-acetyltransferase [Paenibacillus aurantius]WNQ10611.1 GNAT family N-acetyltransferase [Paenibacillus aurantius]
MIDLEVKNPADEELELFVSILREGAEWIRARGQEMWSERQVSLTALLASCRREELYLGSVGKEPAAVMILQEQDQLAWADADGCPSLYLHKLCVRRPYAGTGLSVEMIRWAIREAVRRDKAFLRLDCAADRPQLCRFYEYAGFRKAGERLLFGRYPTALYEYALQGG